MNETPASSSMTACTTALALRIRCRIERSCETFIAVLPVWDRRIAGIEVGFHLRGVYTNDVDGAADQFPSPPARLFGAPDVLAKEDLRAADFLHFEADEQLIVEPRRLQVFDADAAHDEGDPRVAQQLRLLMADLAQPFGAAAFEELQIVGVIDDAAGVGVFVVDANGMVNALGFCSCFMAGADSNAAFLCECKFCDRVCARQGCSARARPARRRAGCPGRGGGRRRRRHAAARRALQEALLDQVGFEHVLDGVARLADGGGEVVDADRAAAELVDHRRQQLAVHDVEAAVVDVEHQQRQIGDFLRDVAAALTSAKSRTRRSRRLAMRGVPRERRRSPARRPHRRHLEQLRRAGDDQRQFLGGVELEPGDDAEAVAQRVGQHAGAGGRADQRERRQIELDRARRRTLADHDVDLEVFQRRIEDLFDDRRQAVDLVDEQHVVRFEIGQDGRQVAGPFEHRARGRAQVDAHLGGDDVRQRRLAEPGGPNRRTWSSVSLRRLAASMKIVSCSRIFAWPT
jgi:hypothetical protein